MGKISNKVSKGLGAAIAEAQAKINGEEQPEVEELLNSGVEAQQKRKRRTKAEMEAARKAEFESYVTYDESQKANGPMTYEETCEYDLKRAVEKELPEPDFDFRHHYEKGQIVYYVHIIEILGIKEVKKLYLRAIYPRMIIGTEEKSYCQCIGYSDRDRIFLTPRDADAYSRSVVLNAKYNQENKKRKSKKDDDMDEDDVTSNDFDNYTSLMEADYED